MTAIELAAADSGSRLHLDNCPVKKQPRSKSLKEKKSSRQCLSLICVKPKPNQNYIVQKYRYLSTYFKILILSRASRSSDLSRTPYLLLCGHKKGAASGGQFKKYHLQCTKACGKIFHSLNDFCNVDKKLLSTTMHILHTRRLKALWTTSVHAASGY